MNAHNRPLVSVLTPTWNRAEYLSDVWTGLINQTTRDFEWVVANDGSDDNTIEVVRELAGKSDFPVTLINASVRIGKSRMDNEAVRRAKGEFIIWCDSDDILLPNALAVLLETWGSVPFERREEFAGVTALCVADGIVLGKKYPKNIVFDLSLNTLLYDMESDLVIFTRSELLKINPFVEVDFLISESSVWNKIGVKKTRFIPEVLEEKRYGEKNCLSLSGVMRYNRGHAHAAAITRLYAWDKLNTRDRAIRIINYIRYCIHGDIPAKESLRLWRRNHGSILLFPFLLPVSLLLAVKDRVQGKVEKTHKQFMMADSKVVIECETLN